MNKFKVTMTMEVRTFERGMRNYSDNDYEEAVQEFFQHIKEYLIVDKEGWHKLECDQHIKDHIMIEVEKIS